jgi:predicted MFS family arabinose efflux permease
MSPGHALFVPAGLVLVGGVLFSATPAVGAMHARDRIAPEAGTGRTLLRETRFVGMLLPVLVAGAVSGTLSIAVPVLLVDDGGPVAAGVALGVFAGGSAVGGVLFGALTVPGSPARQLVCLVAALLVVASSVAVTEGAPAVSVALALAGLFFSPIMVVAYLAAHTAGGEHRQNAATTWVNTSHNLGAAGGSALAGVLIETTGVPAAIGASTLGGVVLLVVSVLLAGRRTRTLPPSWGQREHGQQDLGEQSDDDR